MKKLFSKEDDRYIIEHYKHTTYAELAKHFGLTERQVRGHINNMGLTKMNKKDDSYFDKYLNEVLYLFEQVDADAIVFEDMDRFNSNVIFERLREVNNLTNVQKYNKFCNRKQHRLVQ